MVFALDMISSILVITFGSRHSASMSLQNSAQLISPRFWYISRYLSTISASYPFSVSSALMPSRPILSYLSRLMSIEAMSSSANPAFFAAPRSICLSLMWIVKSVIPTSENILESISDVAATSSISARFVLSPSISISHWVNILNRPFCG